MEAVAALTEVVRDVARTEILPRARRVRGEHKSDGSLFSEADTAAQAALIPRLRRLRDCPVIGEEMTGDAQRAAWGDGTGAAWCVDPIDGTTNFLQGIPYYAVSVALLERGRPVLGVVHNPATGETFHAVAGGGAFHDGERIVGRPAPRELARAVASLEHAVPDTESAMCPPKFEHVSNVRKVVAELMSLPSKRTVCTGSVWFAVAGNWW